MNKKVTVVNDGNDSINVQLSTKRKKKKSRKKEENSNLLKIVVKKSFL